MLLISPTRKFTNPSNSTSSFSHEIWTNLDKDLTVQRRRSISSPLLSQLKIYLLVCLLLFIKVFVLICLVNFLPKRDRRKKSSPLPDLSNHSLILYRFPITNLCRGATPSVRKSCSIHNHNEVILPL